VCTFPTSPLCKRGLCEDQLALFDLVQRGDLLAGVMAVIAPLERWTEKEQT
jgi:type I restriction enzyme, R subunit